MRFLRFRQCVALMSLCAIVGCVATMAQTQKQTPAWNNVGTPMTPEEIRAMAKDTGPSGKNLPPGKGTAKEGMPIYMGKCSMCHGPDLKGVTQPPGSGIFLTGPALVGGKGIPLWGSNGPNSVSKAWYVAYPTTLWNSIAVSMPFFKPGSLTPDEVYSLVAFILAKNEIIKEDAVMDLETLPSVRLPQRDNYIPASFDDILDIQKRGCYKTYSICDPAPENEPVGGGSQATGSGSTNQPQPARTAPTAQPAKP